MEKECVLMLLKQPQEHVFVLMALHVMQVRAMKCRLLDEHLPTLSHHENWEVVRLLVTILDVVHHLTEGLLKLLVGKRVLAVTG